MSSELNSSNESDTESRSSDEPKRPTVYVPSRRPSMLAALGHQHYGSFYLRMGAVGMIEAVLIFHICFVRVPLFTVLFFVFIAFGIGSMIYSGLEFGQYFELERDTKCHNVLLALTPATRMAFIFIQMYFIFLNNEVSGIYDSSN